MLARKSRSHRIGVVQHIHLRCHSLRGQRLGDLGLYASALELRKVRSLFHYAAANQARNGDANGLDGTLVSLGRLQHQLADGRKHLFGRHLDHGVVVLGVLRYGLRRKAQQSAGELMVHNQTRVEAFGHNHADGHHLRSLLCTLAHVSGFLLSASHLHRMQHRPTRRILGL